VIRISSGKRFRKDVEVMRRRGKDLRKLRRRLELLISGDPLPSNYRDHPLRGTFQDARDSHLEPDWLVIYVHEPKTDEIRLIRTGTHQDLFD
jgi:mRNA interferase YafQ